MGKHRKLAATATSKPKKKKAAATATSKPKKKKAAATATSKPKKKKLPEELAAGQRIDEMIQTELARITGLQESLMETLASGEATAALLRESNGLSRALASVSAEQRQRDKHIATIIENLSAEQEDAILREFLEELPRPRRKVFLNLLRALEGNNDLLAL